MKKLLMALLVGFVMVGGAAASEAPTLEDIAPEDGSDGLALDTELEVTYDDADDDTGTVTFYDEDGDELDQQEDINPGDSVTYSPDLEYGETFEWYAEADDGDSDTDNNETETVEFSTLEKFMKVDDEVVEGEFTPDSFSTDNVDEIFVDATVEDDENMTATLRGYNDTEETDSEEFDIEDGENNLEPSTDFSDNTSTYAVEFDSGDDSVVVNEAYATGESTESDPSGIAPGAGGLLTGDFFEGIPVAGQAVEAVTNAFNNFTSFLVEAWTP